MLEESIRIIPEPGLQRLLSRAQSPPVILAMVRIIHEYRPVHIRQLAFTDESSGNVVQPVICPLQGRVDPRVVHRERVREVQLEDDVVLVVGEVDEVLHRVSGYG